MRPASNPPTLPAGTGIPKLPAWDSTLAWRADPYRFLGRQAALLGSDVFEARLLLQPTLCLTGAQAARLFYDDTRFQRQGAAPHALVSTLFGQGGVQGLDHAQHRHRKALFMAITAPERLQRLAELVRREWLASLHDWILSPPFSLYRALQPVLARAVCQWAGVPLADDDLPKRTAQLVALFDDAAAGPVANLHARWARRQAEAWLIPLIEAARSGHTRLPTDTAAHAISTHRDLEGHLLPARVAAVELLNVLRPTVAVSVYMTLLAHALHTHPVWKSRLAGSASGPDAMGFVQEVRRHYPFFPAVAARVRADFDWQGLHFQAGRRVLLDLYGTDHDPRSWPGPDTFSPERWARPTAPSGAFAFVPHGGGDPNVQHRCPGEDLTARLMLVALDMLLHVMRFDLPPQHLDLHMRRLPALPRSGFVIERVRRIA